MDPQKLASERPAADEGAGEGGGVRRVPLDRGAGNDRTRLSGGPTSRCPRGVVFRPARPSPTSADSSIFTRIPDAFPPQVVVHARPPSVSREQCRPTLVVSRSRVGQRRATAVSEEGRVSPPYYPHEERQDPDVLAARPVGPRRDTSPSGDCGQSGGTGRGGPRSSSGTGQNPHRKRRSRERPGSLRGRTSPETPPSGAAARSSAFRRATFRRRDGSHGDRFRASRPASAGRRSRRS